MMIATQVAGQGIVTVSGASISHVTAGTANARVRFNLDGTVDRRIDIAYTQINAATDWIQPNGAAGASYEIRYTLQSGDAPNVGAALNTWIPFTGFAETGYQQVGVGLLSGTIRAEIRKNGIVLDTGFYTLTAQVTP